MKKILFMILLFSTIGFSQITITLPSVLDSGSTTGSTITLPRDLFLGGVVMPDSVSDSLYFQVYVESEWVTLRNEDGAIYYVIPNYDTTSAIALKPDYMYPWKIVRPRITDETVAEVTIYLIGKQY